MLVGQVVDKMPVKRLSGKSSLLADSQTLLGIEIEVEGYTKELPSGENRGYWTIHEDNSLRNNGAEFVFSEPLYGADVVEALDYITKACTSNKYLISERTGIHVHVDVRDMELDSFRTMCTIYALLEKPIYNWIGDGRERNIHCLPWYMADLDIENIGLLFKEDTFTARMAAKNLHRYAGLNLASLSKFGTAEFRHLKTTFDKNRIIDWINIILSIKNAANKWQGTPEQLVKEIRLLGAAGFLAKVVGPHLYQKLWYKEISVDTQEYSIPTAHLFLEHSKSRLSFTDEEIRRRFETVNDKFSDEIGECEIINKWRARFGSKEPAVKKYPKKVFNIDHMSALGSTTLNNQAPAGGTAPQTFWVGSLNPVPAEPVGVIVDEGTEGGHDDDWSYELLPEEGF